MSRAVVTVRLLLADEGTFREVDLAVPAEAVPRYERLIDLLLEDPEVLRTSYVDVERLCAARIVSGEEDRS